MHRTRRLGYSRRVGDCAINRREAERYLKKLPVKHLPTSRLKQFIMVRQEGWQLSCNEETVD